MPDEMVVIEDIETSPYGQLAGEPDDWYERFLTYFAGLGQSRSLRKAYLLHNNLLGENIQLAPPASDWTLAARKYSWKKRATAFDAELAVEVAKAVEQARTELMEASPLAAKALIKSLKNSRTRVSGAKAILDRVGLPPAKEVRHSVEPYSGDELAQAAEEVEQWESQLLVEVNG